MWASSVHCTAWRASTHTAGAGACAAQTPVTISATHTNMHAYCTYLSVALGAGALDQASKVVLHLWPPHLRRRTCGDVSPHHIPEYTGGEGP